VDVKQGILHYLVRGKRIKKYVNFFKRRRGENVDGILQKSKGRKTPLEANVAGKTRFKLEDIRKNVLKVPKMPEDSNYPFEFLIM
jgi:hypothetical protein